MIIKQLSKIAEYLDYSVTHTVFLIRQGKLPAPYKLGYHWVADTVELDKWIAERDSKRAREATALAERKHNKENYNRGVWLTEEIIVWLHSERDRTGETLNEIVVRVFLKATDAAHKYALTRVDILMSQDKLSIAGSEELERLASWIEIYEDEKYGFKKLRDEMRIKEGR